MFLLKSKPLIKKVNCQCEDVFYGLMKIKLIKWNFSPHKFFTYDWYIYVNCAYTTALQLPELFSVFGGGGNFQPPCFGGPSRILQSTISMSFSLVTFPSKFIGIQERALK